MNRFHIVFLFFLILFPFRHFSCNTDSCNIRLAVKLRYENPDSCILICEQLLQKPGRHDSISHKCYELMGDAYWHMGDFVTSVKHYQSALKWGRILKSAEKESRALSNIGYTYMEMGNYDLAVEYLNKAAELALKNNLQRRYQISMIYLAQVWGSNMQFDKAISVQKKLLSQMDLKTDSVSFAVVSANMASNFKRAGLDDSAIVHYNASLAIDEKLGNEKELGNVYGNLAEIYCNKQKFREALAYVEKAILFQEKNKSRSALAATYSVYARILTGLNDAANARKYIEQAVGILPELNSHRMNSYVFEQAAQVYKNIGDMDKAFSYMEKYTSSNDSIFKEESAAKMAQMQTRMEVLGKEKEIELLNKDKLIREAVIQKQSVQRNLLLTGVILVILFAVFIVNRLNVSRKQNKIIQAQKKEVEDQKQLVEIKQKEILDSIHYAERIQRALITSERSIERNLKRLMKN